MSANEIASDFRIWTLFYQILHYFPKCISIVHNFSTGIKSLYIGTFPSFLIFQNQFALSEHALKDTNDTAVPSLS